VLAALSTPILSSIVETGDDILERYEADLTPPQTTDFREIRNEAINVLRILTFMKTEESLTLDEMRVWHMELNRTLNALAGYANMLHKELNDTLSELHAQSLLNCRKGALRILDEVNLVMELDEEAG
ncbi:MAG: hypothetical protein ACFB51_17335, partial [Anaerolineae bacterium]